MTRITGGGLSTKNPFGPTWAGKAQGKSSVGEEVQDTLFGKAKPPILDEDDATIAAQMARLHAYRKRLARMVGDDEDDYDLVLAGGTIAMIDETGLIYVGKDFLLSHQDHVEVLVGVLAHEIGHRPKRWNDYKQQKPRDKEEMEKLCRLEETRADYFAGRALAELNLSCEPLCAFLAAVQTQPHPEYFSAAQRADCIREGHTDGARKRNNRRKFFPELARMHGADNDLGSG